MKLFTNEQLALVLTALVGMTLVFVVRPARSKVCSICDAVISIGRQPRSFR
jgi:transposase